MNDDTSVYEIIELNDEEIALTRIDGTEEPLVSIKFSQESLDIMKSAKIDIAKVMIEAGLDAVAELSEEMFDEYLHAQNGDPIVH